MRRGVPRIELSGQAARAKRAVVLVGANGLQSAERAKPVRVQLVRLPETTSARNACCTIMALHAAAIAHNLDCVLTTLDPEGPHQLRIALRRTRVALRMFRPVMKKRMAAEFIDAARTVGGIVGELRDADVMIDELIAPAARDQPELLSALNAWRQEVRGRVRARLLAANAAGFADALASGAAAAAWAKKGEDVAASGVIAEALSGFRETANAAAARLPDLSHVELHRLRKDVKALRYGTELAVAAGVAGHDGQAPLKRMQDLLGYANDMASLEGFDPPLSGQSEKWRQLRASLAAARAGAVARAVEDAYAHWRNQTP